MEPSTRTGELEPASIEPADFEHAGFAPGSERATARAGDPAQGDAADTAEHATTEVHPSMIAAMHEGCPVCGAPMAVDQRYCLECGERRGPARVPLKGVPARQAAGKPSGGGPRRRASMSVNTTLIAGVGCLLLALGIGVLIGRSGNSSSAKSPSVKVVDVGGAGTAATAATGETATPAAASSTTVSAGKASSTAGTKSSTKVVVKKPTVPLPKPVKVGSPGKGKGYEHGHFTGNFFGGEGEKE
jgi:hypothetical protein